MKVIDSMDEDEDYEYIQLKKLKITYNSQKSSYGNFKCNKNRFIKVFY